MQTLNPVEISEFYIKQVSSGLKKYFWDNIFSKIFEILDDKRNFVINAKDYLEEAIKSGRVYYENGAFRTQYTFSNNVAHQLESLGAKFKYQAYFIDRSTLPLNIEQAIVFKSIQEAQKIERLNAFLASLYGTLDAIKLEEYIELAAQKMYKKLEVDILQSAQEKKIPIIEFKATKQQTEKIAQDYTENMDYWVKNWEEKNIIKMRQDVLKMVQQGARVPIIKQYFQNRWGIAEHKAEFLAVNESHLAGSVIKATYYQDMGFTHFKWDRSSSKEKRKLHEEYYGKVFAYSNPPIIDEKLGERGLPRQIWNCKCHALPVVNQSFFKNSLRIKNAKRNIFEKIKYSIENSSKRNNNPWRYRRFREGQEV